MVGPLSAAEPYAEFLRGLYDRGYGEAALEYLKVISDPQGPALRRGRRDRSGNGERLARGGPRRRTPMSARRAWPSQDHLDKFLRSIPTMPAAAAYVTYGDLASSAATISLRLALLQKQERRTRQPLVCRSPHDV